MAPTGEKARDEDGRIPYTHTGDGVTEQVWPSVADAYEAAYSNKGGTDGKAAYAGTDAEWLDEKALEPVDPSDLASGDLITFDDGSAVVRAQRKEGDPKGGIGSRPDTRPTHRPACRTVAGSSGARGAGKIRYHITV